MTDNNMFVEKYKPKSFDDLVLDGDIKQQIVSAVKNNKLTNMTFVGPAGIGKTTLATLIANETHCEVIRINCAIEGNVATAQNKLIPFCNAMSMDGNKKVVILDELDSASGNLDSASTFQKTLRNVIEAAQDDTVFLATANYPEKIIDPVKSRCPIVHLSFTEKDLLQRIVAILNAEKITYTKDALREFVKSCMVKCYPDIRQVLHYLQLSCTTGTLIVSKDFLINESDVSFMQTLVDKIQNCQNVLDVRQYYVGMKMKMNDYLTAASQLYNYVLDNDVKGVADSSKTILALSDILYKVNVCVDKEAMFFYMIVAIWDAINGLK